jgi:hypothetical protein
MTMANSALLGADEARRIAAELASAKAWPFVEPVRMRRHRSVPFVGGWHWTVVSNADNRGRNVRVEIDAQTGAIVASAFNPR